MAALPEASPVVDERGYVSRIWQRFFAELVREPGPITGVALTGSPLVYAAATPGHLAVRGGTVSSITLTRGVTPAVNLPVGFSSGMVPVRRGDRVTVVYTVAPTVNFVPGV